MNDYMPRIEPDWFSLGQDERSAEVRGGGMSPADADVETTRWRRRCLICHLPLDRRERKVHAGVCAHTREMALQRMRRRSGRA
jgi:hypothetical protein